VRDHDLVGLKHIHWLSHVRKIAERRKSPRPIGERPVATGITSAKSRWLFGVIFQKGRRFDGQGLPHRLASPPR